MEQITTYKWWRYSTEEEEKKKRKNRFTSFLKDKLGDVTETIFRGPINQPQDILRPLEKGLTALGRPVEKATTGLAGFLEEKVPSLEYNIPGLPGAEPGAGPFIRFRQPGQSQASSFIPGLPPLTPESTGAIVGQGILHPTNLLGTGLATGVARGLGAGRVAGAVARAEDIANLGPVARGVEAAFTRKPIIEEAAKLPRQLSGIQRFYHGTAGELEGNLRKDAYLSPIREDAESFARTQSRLTGKPAQVYEFEVEPGGVRPVTEEGLIKARGGVQVENPNKIKLVEDVDRLPKISGGAISIPFTPKNPADVIANWQKHRSIYSRVKDRLVAKTKLRDLSNMINSQFLDDPTFTPLAQEWERRNFIAESVGDFVNDRFGLSVKQNFQFNNDG
ncbi:hypothetical protein HYZ97_04855, partial [Candidatus Pacearchaeota archaeon]|nr:hypothetical protein [Candidatus Pacearchaeota archaeon]